MPPPELSYEEILVRATEMLMTGTELQHDICFTHIDDIKKAAIGDMEAQGRIAWLKWFKAFQPRRK